MVNQDFITCFRLSAFAMINAKLLATISIAGVATILMGNHRRHSEIYRPEGGRNMNCEYEFNAFVIEQTQDESLVVSYECVKYDKVMEDLEKIDPGDWGNVG
jgi:hypothetical protein